MKIERGRIRGLHGNWMSGMAMLVIEDGNGVLQEVPCENTGTVRAFEACFGNTIGEGHTIKQGEEAGYMGQEIFWSWDEMGLMFDGFTPVSEASEELLEAYQRQFDDVEVER